MKRKNTITKEKNRKYLPIILIGIALVLGYAVYSQYARKQSSDATVQSTIPPSSPAKSQLLPSDLTADERFMLNPPSVEASRGAKQKHAQIVAKLAVDGDNIQINNCKPSPLVLHVKIGSEFTMTNNDSVDHDITFYEEPTYKLPANNSLTIKAAFKYGTGDYGYVCGEGIVGFLHITP